MIFNFVDMLGNYESRKVARAKFPWGFISTAMVTDGDKPYETAIQHSDYHHSPIPVEAYDSYDEAEEGHEKWVTVMTNDPPDSLTECDNSGIGQFVGELLGKEKLKYKRNSTRP